MPEKWTGRSQANSLGFSIFIWIIKHFPLGFSYLLLRLVAIFYLFFSAKANNALIEFYTTLKLNRPYSILRRYATFNLFGQALIDKLAIYLQVGKELSFDFENEQQLHQLAQEGKGAILLGAHLGNWEIASQLLHRIKVPIHVVLLDNEEKKIKSLIERNSTGKSFSTIPISEDISFVIKIKEALDNGGFVCMHADRYMDGMRVLEAEFLGKSAKFPLGPFYLGTRLKAPAVFVYAIKDRKFHYQFSCSKAYRLKTSEELLHAYVHLLEQMARNHALQWYNFYPFWDSTH
ncbi:MAG: acyltransferase [Candidatus Parvibacillus calidus]|nr:MAG: acyltransferase [Candidatus Parvibacillus calidus]WKZ62800.1 MAG: lysophospholipid acyltransferase family protein [Saprospiraceae bacterium]